MVRSRLHSIELLESRIAPATFSWNVDRDGNWTSASNWFNVTTGQANDGYPNGVDDIAIFEGHITDDRFIRIRRELGESITLGGLVLTGDISGGFTCSYTISGDLNFEVSSGSASIYASTGFHQINGSSVSTTLRDPLVVTVAGAHLEIMGYMNEGNGSHGLTKQGSGVLRLSDVGDGANTYTGTTMVLEGTLELDRTSAPFAGPLIIGGDNSSATVKLLEPNQIPDTVPVSVLKNGTLDFNGQADTLGSLTLVPTARVLSTLGSTKLAGDLTVTNPSGQPASISLGEALTLTSGNHNFQVAAGVNLEIQTLFGSGLGPSDSLVKTGAGTLILGGKYHNGYAGTIRVDEGTLALAKGFESAAVAGDLVIGDSATPAVLRFDVDHQINDAASITIGRSGTLNLNGHVESVRALTLLTGASTSAKVMTGSGTLTLSDGITIPGNALADTPVSIAGKLQFTADTISFDVGTTLSGAALDFSAAIESSAEAVLVLTGGGATRFSGAATTLPSTIRVEEGTLELAKTPGATAAIRGELIIGSLAGDAAAVRLVTDNQIASLAPVTIFGGATLDLNGHNTTVGPLTIHALAGQPARVVGGGGVLSLGVRIAFAVSAETAGEVQLELDGQLDPAGKPLAFAPAGIPSPGDTFTLISAIPNGALTPFSNAAEGGTALTPGGNFNVTYIGGDGNDLVATPLFISPTIAANGRSATFVDADGDLVTVKLTRGLLSSDQFLILAAGDRGGGQLASLDLRGAADDMKKMALTITAKRPRGGSGDGLVAVGAIEGESLDSVTIKGDLGRIEVADDGVTTPGLKKLAVESLGMRGITTQGAGGNLVSHIEGPIGALSVRQDIAGAELSSDGRIGQVKVGGSIEGGDVNSGSLVADEFGAVTIGGDLAAGQIISTRKIAGVTIGGSILGGAIRAGDDLGKLTVRKDVVGSEDTPVLITARGKEMPTAKADLAIGQITVGGRVEWAQFLAGYGIDTVPDALNGDASIGAVSVGKEWIASDLVAGVDAGADGFFGGVDDVLIGSGADTLVARIASINIKGFTRGSAIAGDGFGIVAQEIGKLTIAKSKQPLTTGVDILTIALDAFAREDVV